jgi:hypothetical protein
MVDHKQDVLTATGSHRAWLGERAGDRPVAGAPLRPSTVLRDGARNWNRPQAATSTNSRHSAITRNLANFPSYKSWTEKMKTNWQKDKPE